MERVDIFFSLVGCAVPELNRRAVRRGGIRSPDDDDDDDDEGDT